MVLRRGIAGDAPYLVTFPVKDHWSDTADILLIERSAHELVALTDELDDNCLNYDVAPVVVYPRNCGYI